MARNRSPTRHRTQFAICGALTLLGMVVYWLGEHAVVRGLVSPFLTAEMISQDFRVRHGKPAPIDPRLVFLGFDRQIEDRPYDEEVAASKPLQLMKQSWPWSREVWAAVIEKLMASGARVVVLDFLFTNPGNGDEVLRSTLRKYSAQVVIGYNKVSANAGHGGSINAIYPSETLIGSIHQSLDILAFVNFWPDADDVIRRAYYYQTDPTLGMKPVQVPSLAARALEKSGWTGNLPTGSDPWRIRFAGAPNRAFPYKPLFEIFVPSLWENNFNNGAYFKDKIVVIGPAANWTQDLQSTPYLERMFGPEVHLHAMNAALSGAFIREPGPLQNLGLIALAGGFAWLLMALVSQPLARAFTLAGGSLAYVAACFLAYNHSVWMLPAVMPLLTFTGCGAGCLFQQFLVDRMEKARTRKKLETYLSLNVVKSMLDRAEEFDEIRKGKRLPCTMLFSDLRGFTTMTEGSDEQGLVVQLNEYFTEMVEAVFRHNGTLDKFIGDAVMAVWGNIPTGTPKQNAQSAVATAVDMLDSLDRLNARWGERGQKPFHIGIGLNHGDVIAADIGSPKKMEFTVIGDAVNLASRLEGVTKEYGLPLVVGESVAALVREEFPLQTVDLIQVKGKTKPVDTFTVLRGVVDTAALDRYEAAVRHYRQGDFAKALEGFLSLEGVWSLNALPAMYIERCRELLAHPPASWSGVFVMKSK